MDYIDDPIASLLSLVPPVGGERIVVGLVGLPGAGKSTQSKIWEKEVNAHAGSPVMQALGMDGFHLSLSELAQLPPPRNSIARRGAPWTFDTLKLARCLVDLQQQGLDGSYMEVSWPDFDHATGEAVPNAIRVEASTRLILVEGLYLLLPDTDWSLKNLFDHTWFLDEDMNSAMGRLIERHRKSWGISAEEAVARIALNDRLNAEIADQTRSFAQALVAPVAVDQAILK